MKHSEFSKLFKIPVPVPAHAEYYYDLLAQSPEFSHLPQLLVDYQAFEVEVGDVDRYVYKIAMPKLLTFFQASKVLETIGRKYLSAKVKPYTIKEEIKHPTQMMVSWDFRQANYNLLRYYEPTFPATWEALGAQLELHPVLMQSKSFRQAVLGQLCPKQIQVLTALHMQAVVAQFPVEIQAQILTLAPDEVVLPYTPVFNTVEVIEPMPIRQTVFNLSPLLAKKQYIKNVWALRPYNERGTTFLPLYSTLFGVPQNKYFQYFKEYILKQAVEPRDLQFMVDGEVAQWIG